MLEVARIVEREIDGREAVLPPLFFYCWRQWVFGVVRIGLWAVVCLRRIVLFCVMRLVRMCIVRCVPAY